MEARIVINVLGHPFDIKSGALYISDAGGGEFQARISGQNFRAEAGEFQTHVRGVSDAHNGAFQTHYGIIV